MWIDIPSLSLFDLCGGSLIFTLAPRSKWGAVIGNTVAATGCLEYVGIQWTASKKMTSSQLDDLIAINVWSILPRWTSNPRFKGLEIDESYMINCKRY